MNVTMLHTFIYLYLHCSPFLILSFNPIRFWIHSTLSAYIDKPNFRPDYIETAYRSPTGGHWVGVLVLSARCFGYICYYNFFLAYILILGLFSTYFISCSWVSIGPFEFGRPDTSKMVKSAAQKVGKCERNKCNKSKSSKWRLIQSSAPVRTAMSKERHDPEGHVCNTCYQDIMKEMNMVRRVFDLFEIFMLEPLCSCIKKLD